MEVYAGFAHFYAEGPYPHFGQRMAELLPVVLGRFDFQPQAILDLACGEGTFAMAMAGQGFQVTGVDLSMPMLELARGRARQEGVAVSFFHQDMRFLSLEGPFDLATCWFDSLNYLLEASDLQRTFAGVHRAVRERGLFVFDMNTVYGLAVQWQRRACYVQQDTPVLFEVHRPAYDYERNIATLRITGFSRQGQAWVRMDESHRQRGYTLDEVRACFQQVGWQELACWDSLQEMSEPGPESGRVWFVLRKDG